MHIYKIQEICSMVKRLVQDGLPLKHAVNVTASSYGFEPDDVYRALEANASNHNSKGDNK